MRLWVVVEGAGEHDGKYSRLAVHSHYEVNTWTVKLGPIFYQLSMLVAFLVLCSAPATMSNGAVGIRITHVDSDAKIYERKKKISDSSLVLFLFGAFSALWAQNTGRNAWLWFFMGLLFSVITVIVLLTKNSTDNFDRKVYGRTTRDLRP